MAGTKRHFRSTRAGEGSSPAVVVLWVVAMAFAAVAIYLRYGPAVARYPGDDFLTFFSAARHVASGLSPYSYNPNYVYPPLLGFIGAPFSHISATGIWRAWIAIILVAPLFGVGAFISIQADRITPVVKPIVFLLCSVTLYVAYWPMGRELFLGQTDSIVFPMVVLAALAAARERPVKGGLWLGLSGLVKLWPAAIGVSFFQSGNRGRWKGVAALIGSMVLAPVLAVVVGGASGFAGFFSHVFDAGKQHLVNDSVWTAPNLLFSRSGLASPLVVSPALRVLVTLVLAAWVIGLLLLVLRTTGDPVFCMFNATFCVILLLPIAHRQYALYVLPLIWLWILRLWQLPSVSRRDLVVAGVMVVWWALQTHSWPYNGDSSSISSVDYCVPFIADVVACSVSVLAASGRFGPMDLRPSNLHRVSARATVDAET